MVDRSDSDLESRIDLEFMMNTELSRHAKACTLES